MSQQSYRIGEHIQWVQIDQSQGVFLRENSSELVQSIPVVKIMLAITSSEIGREEIIRHFSDYGSLQDVLRSLDYLDERGYIHHETDSFPGEQAAFWRELGYDPVSLFHALSSNKIEIVSIGNWDVDSFQASCEAAGIQISSDSPSLRVVLTPDYLHPELDQFNQLAIERKWRWLLVKSGGATPLIGPYFDPGSDSHGCWKCLEHRLLLNQPELGFYRSTLGEAEKWKRPCPSHILGEAQAIGSTVMEVIGLLYHGNQSPLSDKIIRYNLQDGSRSEHVLTLRPQCSACGDPGMMNYPPEPIVLQPNELASSMEGGYRSVKPEETFQKYAKHIGQLTGIVPFVVKSKRYTGAPFHNYLSGRNLGLHGSSLYWLNHLMKSANGGKGRSDEQARTSALCEAIERFCMVFRKDNYSISGTLETLEGAIHPNDCMLFSLGQFQSRNHSNAGQTRFFSLTPEPFDKDVETKWTPVFSLTEQKFKYLPSFYCYSQYPFEEEQSPYAYPDSNGCAAGNTIEEAILQGLLELIERDAAAIWWYNRIQRPGLDLTEVTIPFVQDSEAYFSQIGRSLTVLDLSTDLGIPVFAAISYKTGSEGAGEVLYGFGAHLDASIALERAISELGQVLPMAEEAKAGNPIIDPQIVRWIENISADEQNWLRPSAEKRKKLQEDYPSLCDPGILEGINYCLEVLKRNELEVLVLDLTQPDVGLPVVRVIVPGLRHFWRRLGPGRLYTVPWKMGWIQEPLKESELNPFSIFI